MSFPKECPFCNESKAAIIGISKDDYIKRWECSSCKKQWNREFNVGRQPRL